MILSSMQPPDARLEPVRLFGWTDDDIISVGVETTEEGTGVYNKELIFRMYEVDNITSYEHLGNRLLNWIRWTSSNGSTFSHFDCSIIRRLSPRVKSCGKRQFFFTQWPKERHKWSWLHPLVLKEHFPARKSWHILIWEKRFSSQKKTIDQINLLCIRFGQEMCLLCCIEVEKEMNMFVLCDVFVQLNNFCLWFG
jgi:hypothetical protein